MGILDLNKVLNAMCGDCFKDIPWSNFTGKRVAIDVDVPIYAHSAIQDGAHCSGINFFVDDVDDEERTKATIQSLVHWFTNTFVNAGVTPVIVFGGEAPKEKDEHARADRIKKREKAETDYKQYLAQHQSSGGKDVAPAVYNKLCKLKKLTLRPARDFAQQLRRVLEDKHIGIILQAKAEAEELCAALCLEGIVDAVYSTDTDNIVRRCPLLITKIERKTHEHINELTAEVTVYSNNVPHALGLDYAGFVDLCILLQCDYNKRKRGWGQQKCLKLMQEYKSIEAIVEAFPEEDFSNYNYERCRDIFNLYHQRNSKDCCENPDMIDFIPASRY